MRDEFAKIDWLKSRFELDGDCPMPLVVGIGDDAAVFDFGSRPTIVTVDTQVEGRALSSYQTSSRFAGCGSVKAR